VLIPEENEKDLEDIPAEREGRARDHSGLDHGPGAGEGLTRLPTPIEWSEADAPPVSVADDDGAESVITH